MGLASTLVQGAAGFPCDKHPLACPAQNQRPAITRCERQASGFHRRKKKKPRTTPEQSLGYSELSGSQRGCFQELGLSPYQRGVYTHSPPPARGNTQVVDEPISTMVRMSTCSGVSCPKVVTRSVWPGRPMSRPSTTGVCGVRCSATISRARPSCQGRDRPHLRLHRRCAMRRLGCGPTCLWQ